MARVLLAVGLALSLGRWPVHWRHQPALAAIAALLLVALVAGVGRARPAAIRAAAAISLVDAVLVIRAWSARLPLHCNCVKRPGAPALVGWGGAIIATDVAVCALAVWLARPQRRLVT